MNEDHEPSGAERRVLETLKEGRAAGEPWGYTTPMRVAEAYGMRRQRVNEALDRLEAAGWIEQVSVDGTDIRGLYRFVGDPRED